MIKQSQETYRLNYWVQIVLWKKKLEYAAQATIKIAEIIIKDWYKFCFSVRETAM